VSLSKHKEADEITPSARSPMMGADVKPSWSLMESVAQRMGFVDIRKYGNFNVRVMLLEA
jgi:hypothetical protein